MVIDHNIQDNKEISFKYYLGRSKRKKFKVILDRNVEYGKWIDFIDASRESFELYFSSQSIVTTNKTPIDDNSIKKRILKIDTIDEDASVYIRLVSPTVVEYVVAYEDEIESSSYLTDIKAVEIKV